MSNELIDKIKFNDNGLVPAIAQQYDDGQILMMAWMNKQSINETLQTGQVCYYSRSRGKLWRKGESSGQTQKLVEMRLDCDGDTILLQVDQQGVACHTGTKSCFHLTAKENNWQRNQPVIISPQDLYND